MSAFRINRRHWLGAAGAGWLSGCAAVAPQPSAQSRPRLRVALISNVFEYAPIWLAAQRGYFADAGIDVSYSVLGSVPKVTEGVKAGEFEIGAGVPEGVVLDVESGGDLRFIGGLSRKVAVSLITQPKFKRIEDLKGARLGVSGLREGTGVLMQEVATRYGMKADDIRLTVAGIHTTRWEKLQSGEIDAALQPFPFNLMATEKGYSNLGEFPDLVPAYQFIALFVRKSWLDGNADTARKFMAGLRRGIEAVHQDRDATVALAMRQAGMSAAHAQQTWSYYVQRQVLHPQGHIDPAALDKTLEVMARSGSVPADRAALASRYLDTRAVQQ